MLGRQEHLHLSPTTEGMAVLGPQGLGSQGSVSTGRIAKKYNFTRANHAEFLLTFWFQFTCSERIPNVVLDASTSRDVVLNSTNGIDTTSTRARIRAMQLLTCFV